MNDAQRNRMNDSIATLFLSMASAYAMTATRQFAENLSGRTSSIDVSREFLDWQEAESQLRHAFATYVALGKDPVVRLGKSENRDARSEEIRKRVYESVQAWLCGQHDAMPNLRDLPALPPPASKGSR